MLDNVLGYVKSVNDGSKQGDARIGRYLLETLASVPMATSSKGQFEEDFNNHLAVRTGAPCRACTRVMLMLGCAGPTHGLVPGQRGARQSGGRSSCKYDARFEVSTPFCVDAVLCI